MGELGGVAVAGNPQYLAVCIIRGGVRPGQVAEVPFVEQAAACCLFRSLVNCLGSRPGSGDPV